MVALPFHANTLDVVVAQKEVLEHVEDPFRLVADILKFSSQVDILLSGSVCHWIPSRPNRFWRFTKESFILFFGKILES